MRPAPRRQRLHVGAPAVLALGGNVGDRVATLRAALDALAAHPGIRVERVSPLYETPALKPDGISREAPAYLNAVVLIHTVLDPLALLAAANRIEDGLGRVREERWGDRTIDVDIVDYSGIVSDDPRVTLPHPRAHERAFVLVPWRDIAPDAVLPGHGRVADLAARATDPVTPFEETAP
ncbi:2-amino-4-hydroxy-6-hydroxymethyldihydropteridine pyrophosphokinase [Leifsonia xyli subsp. cynodontis DSM 46306]|uniref:2-amino-4-hydroxy-6-hydroxymethyldihydropteridine diphosphokinase n=1 Tax=Leifsonia xyli subsp. cynodontis DSM 46306 TaxID=1389489 RepID=U3P480_LEIXC|nr:2-amino-4-hydroxy-6-hydroxymethyldihydropteridine diphosphokinase [Leifsonia xyli]AGW40561.1 2-amino-4-hydroxy-6-hydroxymethyldihydropteridine pyrophosphokinase [Leifsonia xyli subsp. cynodontis DSM 46306]